MLKMKMVEFDGTEISKKAFNAYTNSDYCFYKDKADNYYYACNQNESTRNYLGSLKDVQEFLENDADEVPC